MNTFFLTLENIAKYYASGQSVVMGLNNITLSFSANEFVAITGESGSGKSTLAKVIAGILPYENGEMTLNGKPTSHYNQADWEHYRSNQISFISQSYDILPGCTVLKNVVSSLILTGMDKETAGQKSEEILRRVELWNMRNRRAAKLSSGQKQRLSIARALAKPAPILIADEPTGNLDRENSEKVIALLASAAKERLVFIVTHDFAEVENLATRHITIRDGAVDSDIALQNNITEESALSPTEPITRFAKKKGTRLSLYTAALQISSRPVWSFIMLLFFTLTAFAMFAFLGTFVVNLDDRFTRIYDESAFYNGSDDLLYVMRGDKEFMGEEDWNTLLNTKYVKQLERYGYLSEINYYYRENIDYHKEYIPEADSVGNLSGKVNEKWVLGSSSIFMQTVPVYAEDTGFLTAGRLPENMYEIIAVGDESMLGKTMPVFIRFRKWTPYTYIVLDTTVVGVTDKGNGLYFDERLADSLTGQMISSLFFYGYDREFNYTDEEIASGSLPLYQLGNLQTNTPMAGRFRCSENLFQLMLESIEKSKNKDDQRNILDILYDTSFTYAAYNNRDVTASLKPGFTHNSTYNGYLLVEPEVFDTLVPTEFYGDIVSLRMQDYAYTKQVMDAISQKGYICVSPYQIGSTKQDPELAAERLQTLKICLLCFGAVFLLQIMVLRAMFGMETEELRLLANLGLRCNTAKLSVIWQILSFTVCGQFLAFAVIVICNQMEIRRIADIVKYLPAPHVLFFMLIHLLTGLLTSLWIQRSMAKQVYPYSLQKPDLDLDEEV